MLGSKLLVKLEGLKKCKAGLMGNLSHVTNKPDWIVMGVYVGTNVVVLLSPTIELRYCTISINSVVTRHGAPKISEM